MKRTFAFGIITFLCLLGGRLGSAAGGSCQSDVLQTSVEPRHELPREISARIDTYLDDTLNSLEKMRGKNGLVADTIWLETDKSGNFSIQILNQDTSPTNIAVDILIQSEFAFKSRETESYKSKLPFLLSTLDHLSVHPSSGLYFSRYTADQKGSVKDPSVSSIDNLNLAIALWTIKETFPRTKVAETAARLFNRMDFSIFYDDASGLIGGNLVYENGVWRREAYNFANLGSEARSLYSAGWALGLFKKQNGNPEFLAKAFASLKAEVYHSDDGNLLKLWDGAAFQLYFPKIFISEEKYSAMLGRIYRADGNYMISEGHRRDLPVPAAHSPGRLNRRTYNDKAGNINLVSSDNKDVLNPAYRKNWESTFTPYALFMAATSDPEKFIPILSKLEDLGKTGGSPSKIGTLYLPSMGWMDGFLVEGHRKGAVIPSQLSLNQGMIALSLFQIQAPDRMTTSGRALFHSPKVNQRLRQFYKAFERKLENDL